MAYWNTLIYQREDLLVQYVLMRKWSDGLSAGHLPNSLACLLKANSCNHVHLYVGTWGPFNRSAPVWCVQVMLYEKELSYGVRVVRHTFYVAPETTPDNTHLKEHISTSRGHKQFIQLLVGFGSVLVK
jgi:hypothetical protein